MTLGSSLSVSPPPDKGKRPPEGVFSMASHTQAKIVIKDQNDVKDAVKGISSDLMDLTQIL